MKTKTKCVQLLFLLTMLSTTPSCLVRGGVPLLAAVVGTAIVTAAIVSAVPPPPPRVVYVPPPRVGYEWQPGYWTVEGRRWVWVEGRWIASQPGYRWAPSHWNQAPDGSWHLVPGQWVPL